jgi:hypothetical protein
MSVRVGGRYRYRTGDYIVDTQFCIESFDGTRYKGIADDWSGAVWFFDSDGVQVGTKLSPDSGCSSVRLILEDDNGDQNSSWKNLS